MQSSTLQPGLRAAGCSGGLPFRQIHSVSIRPQPGINRTRLVVQAFGNFGKGKSGDDARKSLENMFGGGKGKRGSESSLNEYLKKQMGKGPKEPTTQQGGGGLGGIFGGNRPGGGGGGGDSGGWKWGKEGEDEGAPKPEQPIGKEILAILKGCWVLGVNAAIFLIFADILHRSLDWCCQVELLLLVGAPRQAFERVATQWYKMVEWIEENMLGWKLPREQDEIPMYKNIALYYPTEHAYTFEQYKHAGMTPAEKETLKNFFALRYWERDGGFAGDTPAREVQAILDKYNPRGSDLQRYQQLKAEGREGQYWEEQAAQLQRWTGSSQPPVGSST